ncbi:hypothetical protein [Acetobacter cerevisiae]|uniref:SGNH hydrolase-type esterase domain-containing protein n=1 Tax=Acetobacter cerevisiae TaxID=178900 RepID=A0A149QXT6_9PROT|nr:hypothetical protein [Acetobacter cerevisiae]KXV02115.1 hypothetical protein AD928_01200 [Acetobacter cerevisiae]GBQ08877.1 hypothetical protein AA14362_2075 [Acetobacter cerevisiae DSM 14362]
MFNRLLNAQKHIVIIGLNHSVGRDQNLLEFFGEINDLALPLATKYSFDYIDMSDVLTTEDDLNKDGMFGGAHFDRPVYKALSDRILNLLQPAH